MTKGTCMRVMFALPRTGSRPRVGRSGVSFRCELQTSWNVPELYLPGVVELDTSVVPDVLGMRVHYEDAELTRVLPGRAQKSVRVLVPDARAKPRGFHDVTLVDMTNVAGPAVLTADMSHLRRQWPTSLLTGMTRRQTDLELLRRECKCRFRDMQSGVCTYCRRHIMHDMARHVSMYHLDLGQLWWCPVLWCSYWKGTPQDCIDHIRLRHHVGLTLSGEVVPAMDSYANSMKCGVEAECVWHLYRRGAFQRAWCSGGPPLPGYGNCVSLAL